jgi:polar amino acid transport system substrate-binding protein
VETSSSRKRCVTIVGAVVLTVAFSTVSGAFGQPAKQQNSSAARSLIVAADPALLPYQFYKRGTRQWQGINIDIGKALSARLGRPLVFKAASFDTIIPGLKSGRYDLSITGMFDTKARQKVLNFIDYLEAKSAFLQRKSDVRTLRTFADLCGLKVGLNKGSFEVDLAKEQSDKCTAAGKDPLTMNVYPDLNANILALASRRVDVVPNDSATNAYLVKTRKGQFASTGAYGTEGYFAAAFPKRSPHLQPVFRAFRGMAASGQLRRILARWGIADRAVPRPYLNRAAF